MSLKERINLVKQQFGISEADTLNIEKALGKKLVDYESIEALVAALMEYYNGELKKKANTSHTHDYAPSSHKHKKADISDFPTSMKNPNALEIKMNGQNPVSYDGAAAESINITASGIGAEPSFSKNGAFNKNFGTTSNTVLEGAKLAEILGLTYGGNLNTSSAKTVNYAYYDSTTKKVYKCIKATSINYADANYFEAISNNDLLGKLQNLNDIPYIIKGNFTSFKALKSLKCLKNKSLWFQVIPDTDIGSGAATWFYQTPPKSNIGLAEGTLIYDNEDSDYIYYHIDTSQVDNAIIIIQ